MLYWIFMLLCRWANQDKILVFGDQITLIDTDPTPGNMVDITIYLGQL